MAVNKPLVKECMHSPVITISAEAGLDRALLIMRKQHVRHLPVVDDGKMIGLLSDRDLRLSMQEMEQGPGGAPKGYYLPALKKVKTVMATKVVTVNPEMTVAEAATTMSEHKFGALPVVEPGDGKLVGMITETDLLKLLVKLLQEASV